MNISMFKSCFPNANIWGSPDDPPNDDPSPPCGFSPNSPDHNVANVKRIYVDILEYFESRQGDHPFHIVGTSGTHVVTEQGRLIVNYPHKDYLPVVSKQG